MFSYAEIVSTFAAIVGLGGLYLHWRRWLADVREKSVLATFKIRDDEELPSGYKLLVMALRSRSSIGYTATKASVLWPLTARLASWRDLHEPHPDGEFRGYEIKRPDRKLDRSIELNLSVAHAGKEEKISAKGHYLREIGERSVERAYIRLPRDNGRALISMRITPEDPKEKEIIRRQWVHY